MLASLMEAVELSQIPNHCSSVTFLPDGKTNSVWSKEEPDEKELYNKHKTLLVLNKFAASISHLDKFTDRWVVFRLATES